MRYGLALSRLSRHIGGPTRVGAACGGQIGRYNALKINNMRDTPHRRIEAIVFDMDGVLIDSEPVHYESTRLLFLDELGVTLKEPINNEFLGSTDRYMFEVLRERYRLEVSVDDLIDRRKVIYMNLVEKQGLPWRDGILNLIADLAASRYRLAVASSSLKRIIDHTLESGGIRRYFEAIVSGDEITAPKPAPEIYLEAARRLRIDPVRCAAIEDTDVGVRSAKAAGMFTIAFPCPTTAKMDFSSADAVIRQPGEVPSLLYAEF